MKSCRLYPYGVDINWVYLPGDFFKIYDYLFANSSFLEGVARLFDFGSTMNVYNDDALPPEEEAILEMESDWNLVAQDLKAAIGEYEKE